MKTYYRSNVIRNKMQFKRDRFSRNKSTNSNNRLRFNETSINLYGLNISLRKKFFFFNADFRLNKGITALTGESGQGKSLFSLFLFGLLPDYFTVSFDYIICIGLDGQANKFHFYKQYKRFIYNTDKITCSFMPQDALKLLNKRLSIFDNLYQQYNSYNKVSRTAFFHIMQQQFSLLNLDFNMFYHLNVLLVSGGMLKRICVIYCLLLKPNILLIDEPTAGLDYMTQIKFMIFLKKVLKLYGCPKIIIITHNKYIVKHVQQYYTLQNYVLKKTLVSHE